MTISEFEDAVNKLIDDCLADNEPDDIIRTLTAIIDEVRNAEIEPLQ